MEDVDDDDMDMRGTQKSTFEELAHEQKVARGIELWQRWFQR